MTAASSADPQSRGAGASSSTPRDHHARPAPRLGPWLLPIGAVSVSLLLRLWLAPILGPATPFMMFVLAVAVSAWYGGLGPGILATALAAIAGTYFVLVPEGSFALAGVIQQVQLALFVTVGLTITGLAESLRRAQASTRAAERIAHEEREWLRVTIRSVGDGVIATDERGRVRLLNPAAERMTGVPAMEAVGAPLGEIFRIVNEDTRAPTEDPVTTVLREGKVVGLANHTLLLGRDGVERPISDSGAPIQDDAGRIRGVVLVFLDDTARRQAERERERLLQDMAAERARLDDSERRYRTLFESIDEGFCLIEMIFDADERPVDYRFLEMNPAFEHHTGLRDAVGRTALELVPNLEPFWIETYGQVAQSGKSVRFVSEAAALGGRCFDVYACRLGEASRRRVAVVFNDITARKRAEDDVLRLNAELEQRVRDRTASLEAINRELEAFSYSVSHDLRAPLRGVDGFANIVLRQYGTCLDEQGRHYLERIRAGTQRMGRLIDDLLRLSRISRADLRWLPVDLGAVALSVVEELRKAGRDVEVAIAQPVHTVGDPQLLRVVLENLLGNAWKFTGGTAGARIEFGETPHEGARAFYVRDNGAGFDMQYADRLFTAFQRLHDASEFEGSGIGLATVQRIVSRHGGRVWAEARPGEGATFWFTIGEAVAA